MDRVFLDANVLFSAAYKSTSPLRTLWELENATLLSSAYAITEAITNLSLAKYENLNQLLHLISGLEVTGEYSNIQLNISLTEKDKPILQAAIASKATHLLTGDKNHFGHLFEQSVEGVLILTPSFYLTAQKG